MSLWASLDAVPVKATSKVRPVQAGVPRFQKRGRATCTCLDALYAGVPHSPDLRALPSTCERRQVPPLHRDTGVWEAKGLRSLAVFAGSQVILTIRRFRQRFCRSFPRQTGRGAGRFTPAFALPPGEFGTVFPSRPLTPTAATVPLSVVTPKLLLRKPRF